MELDDLQIRIEADAANASNAINKLVNGLTRLGKSVSNVDSSKLQNISTGIRNVSDAVTGFKGDKSKDFAALARSIGKLSSIDTNSLYSTSSAMKNLASGMSGMSGINVSGVLGVADALQKLGGVKATTGTENLIKIKDDLANFVKGLNSIGSVSFDVNSLATLLTAINKLGGKSITQGTANLPTLSAQLQNLVRQMNNIGSLSFDTSSLSQLVMAISKLGGSSIARAVANMPALEKSLSSLLTTLSAMPPISTNVIQMTNALANLASQGSKVGTASKQIKNSFDKVSSSSKKTTNSVTSLAAAFGKFYASYFFVIRGIKSLWKSIEGTTDYIEAFNYYAVAFNKIGTEWAGDFEKYGKELGYKTAEEYSASFAERVNEKLGKMSGLNVNIESGLLEESRMKNLGLNIQEITQYASQLASVTNSLGQTGETTTAVAKSMTMLAGDISSLFNVDFETVANNLQSGLIGQSRAEFLVA